jgi:hypothetical protein
MRAERPRRERRHRARVTATRSFCSSELESLANYLLLERKPVARIEAFLGTSLTCVERTGALTSFSRTPPPTTYALNLGPTRSAACG